MMRAVAEVVVAVRGRVDVDALRSAIEAEAELALIGVIDSDAAWASRASLGGDALVVACDGASDAVIDLISQEVATRPHMPVLVVSPATEKDFVHRAFAAGADDILNVERLDVSGPQIAFAVEKALTRKSTPEKGRQDGAGELICVLGPKGGTGKTLTASNLSTALVAENKRVALVDLDLQFGDLGLVMGVTPERTSFDLATSGGSLDAEKVEAFMVTHRSGVQLLLAPTRPDQASSVTSDFLRELYVILRSSFDYVVVDTPPGFTPEVIATIDAATSVCLIGTLDAPSLKNAKLGAETLELMGYPGNRVRVVLNRADTNVGVTHADVVSVLGRAPDVLVPSSRDIVRSVNAGEPIVLSSPRSEAAKAFRALAQIFIRAGEARVSVVEPRRRSLKPKARV